MKHPHRRPHNSKLVRAKRLARWLDRLVRAGHPVYGYTFYKKVAIPVIHP